MMKRSVRRQQASEVDAMWSRFSAPEGPSVRERVDKGNMRNGNFVRERGEATKTKLYIYI